MRVQAYLISKYGLAATAAPAFGARVGAIVINRNSNSGADRLHSYAYGLA
jgi:hypothetical protein